jgi:hypothetical protein
VTSEVSTWSARRLKPVSVVVPYETYPIWNKSIFIVV